jgi:membrane protease YdiL (CAAX protease family)
MDESRFKAPAISVVVLVVLAMAEYSHEFFRRFAFYKGLRARYPFYVPESIDKVAGALLCCLAIYWLHRLGWKNVLRELGIDAHVLRALIFALLASSPMLIGFALTRKFSPRASIPSLLFFTAFSPFVEELEFRGFGFWQLYRRARRPFWLAILPPAVLFALGHVEKGQNWQEVVGIFLLTGTGAAVFSWLLDSWQSLWVPVALHALMNLWWELFSVSRTAVGGWLPFVSQTSTVALAILLTVCAKRRGLLPKAA